MKKILAGLLIAGLFVAFGAKAQAANFVGIDLNVTCGELEISLACSSFTSVSIGYNQTTIFTSSFTVRNVSAGVPVIMGLKTFDSNPWVLAKSTDVSTSSAAINKYAMQGLFNSSLPVAGDFAIQDCMFPSDTIVYAGDAAGEAFYGDQNASNVAPNADVDLWVRLMTPGTGTGIGARTMGVTVEAAVAP